MMGIASPSSLTATVACGCYRRETTLGAADDILDADGLAALDFGQAQAAARVWFAEKAREAMLLCRDWSADVVSP